MKKLFFLVSLVVLLGVSGSVMGQGSQKTETINSTRKYWVNSNDGTTQNAEHIGNTYAWNVYAWNGSEDYTATSWTAIAATSGTDFNFVGSSSGSNIFYTSVKWLKTGTYVVEVIETSTGSTTCNTKRRFGVTIIDLDLSVITKNHLGNQITTATTYCNTNEGSIYGAEDDEDLNSATVTPVMGEMTMTYEISLFTSKGGASGTNIATVLPTASWKFTIVDASTIPSSPGSVTWTVTGAAGTYTTGGTNTLTVSAGTSVVTVTAKIKNIAAKAADDYELKFDVAPSSVLVENGGTNSNDYAEGQEPTTYIGGTAEPTSHKNSAVQITVNPIPNTSKIKFN